MTKEENDKVKLYSSQTSYIIINVGQPVNEARWSGDSLVVYLDNGKVRRYTTQTTYTIV